MRDRRPIRTVDRMHHTAAQPATSSRSTTWARVFARTYDSFLWVGERRGARTHRAELLAHARGRTVEIGAGTGLNVPLYPEGLDDLTLTEPDPSMRRRLEAKVHRSGVAARVVEAPAERLPFEDASVDTVVSTYVLCTVDDLDVVLQEIVRVLRPGGRLLFLEHVRSDSAFLASWQDRLARPWCAFARGCRCNQATGEAIGTGGFDLEDVRLSSWRGMPPIVRPLIAGMAVRSDR